MTVLTIISYIIRTIIALVVFKPAIDWFVRRRKYVNVVNKIPGYKGYPIIGSLWLTFNKKREEMIEIALARPKLFPGGISRAWLGPFAEVRVDNGNYV